MEISVPGKDFTVSNHYVGEPVFWNVIEAEIPVEPFSRKDKVHLTGFVTKMDDIS